MTLNEYERSTGDRNSASVEPDAESFDEVLVRHADRWPDELSDRAYHGIAGEIIRRIEPHTEADPVAILAELLVVMGHVVGRHAHFMVESTEHYMNLFAVLVGDTSKARKGTSWIWVRRLILRVDPEWGARVTSGLSSGEGLIWNVRDEIERWEKKKKQDDPDLVIVDPGVDDKRMLLVEGEYASPFQVMARSGSTLSPLIRCAWDTGDLQSLTKNSPEKSTGAHISILEHITVAELRKHLSETEAANGFANRHMFFCVRRSKALPEGGSLDDEAFDPFIERLRQTVEFANRVGRLHRDAAATAMWKEVYPELWRGRPGLLGAVISRAEAQVLRLSCIYALLDQSELVCREHLEAALAVWAFAEASVGYLFGDRLGDSMAETILAALRDAGDGLSRTEINSLFGRHKKAAAISESLATLLRQKIVQRASPRPYVER